MPKTIRVPWTSMPTTHYLFLRPGVLRQGEPRRRNHCLQLQYLTASAPETAPYSCLHRRHRKEPSREPTAPPCSRCFPHRYSQSSSSVCSYKLLGKSEQSPRLGRCYSERHGATGAQARIPRIKILRQFVHYAQSRRYVQQRSAYATTSTQRSFSTGERKEKIPSTFKKAMGLRHAARWKPAHDREVTSLEKHGVYELILTTSFQTGQRVVSARWGNKIKADGRYSHIVVQGWSQVSGIYCGGTFAPYADFRACA